MMAVDGRRLWRAGLLTLAVFLLVGGGIGFAAAAQEGGAEPLSVPAPRPADRATYRVTSALVPGLLPGTAVDSPLDEVVYEWLPERKVQDRSFIERASQPLQVTYVFRWAGNETRQTRIVDFDAVTGEPFRSTAFGQHQVEPQLLPGGQTFNGINVATPSQPPIDVQWAQDVYDPLVEAPCAQRTVLHGSDQPPQELSMGGCGWPDLPRPTYTPVAWERLPLGRAFRFDATGVPLLQTWHESGNPFPLRFTSPLTDAIGPGESIGRLFILERTAWAAGTQEYPAHGAEPVQQGRPLPLSPLLAGPMLDDEGLGDDLPLSVAYGEAERAPRSNARQSVFGPLGMAQRQPSVREWHESHPDGYLAQAVRWESIDWYGETNPFWRLLWVDGDSWLGKEVSLEPSHEDPFSAHLPAAAGRRIVVADWWPTSTPARPPDGPDPQDLDAMLRTFPPRALLGDALPDASAVADRFLESFPRAHLNSYGFRFACRENCSMAGVVVWAGALQNTFDSSTGATGGYWTYSSLTVDETGLASQRYVEVKDSAPVLLGLGAPASDDAPMAATTGPAGLWAMPTGPAATGIGAVALLAGALYYFWPALKGGFGVGLFSRIDDGRVLDLPARRRLYDAILAEPGIHFMALSRDAGVGRGALDHHLRRLVAAELVVVRKARGYTCYFAKGAVDRKIAGTAPALRSEGSRAVFDAVRAEPGLSCRELARRLGRSPSTVNYHLQRLREAGLVFGAGAGVHPSPLAEQAAAMAA